MRLADLRRQPMLPERRLHARDEVAAIGFVIDVLQLASPALREVAARRFLVVGSRRKRSVVKQGIPWDPERNMAPARGHSISARRDANDEFVHRRRANSCGIASTRSS